MGLELLNVNKNYILPFWPFSNISTTVLRQNCFEFSHRSRSKIARTKCQIPLFDIPRILVAVKELGRKIPPCAMRSSDREHGKAPHSSVI